MSFISKTEQLIPREETPDFTADKSWVEHQQNRWLAWLEIRHIVSGEPRVLSFTQIEEVVGMSPWDGRAIMDTVSKKLRNSL